MTKAHEADFDTALLAALPKARAYATRLAGADGEDLAQDAVVKALAARNGFEPETHMAAWLRTIVRREHRDAWRHRKIELAAVHVPVDETEGVSLPAPEDAHERLELVEVLAAIQALPEGQRPIMQSVMLGFSVEEAAHQRGCAPATAKNQLLRGRATLRQKFG